MSNTRRFPITVARLRREQMGLRLRVEPYDARALERPARECDITLSDQLDHTQQPVRVVVRVIGSHEIVTDEEGARRWTWVEQMPAEAASPRRPAELPPRWFFQTDRRVLGDTVLWHASATRGDRHVFARTDGRFTGARGTLRMQLCATLLDALLWAYGFERAGDVGATIGDCVFRRWVHASGAYVVDDQHGCWGGALAGCSAALETGTWWDAVAKALDQTTQALGMET